MSIIWNRIVEIILVIVFCIISTVPSYGGTVYFDASGKQVSAEEYHQIAAKHAEKVKAADERREIEASSYINSYTVNVPSPEVIANWQSVRKVRLAEWEEYREKIHGPEWQEYLKLCK